tara:strand:- start:95 stop:412 length:318 start_codon:yes stop_codon:yes gene_type:complete
MKKQKFMFNDDVSIDEYHQKQATIFRNEFEEELNRQNSIEEPFSDELKHIQKMALNGKLNPQHKQTLEEWREMYPDRFDNFCEQMNEANRYKLLHFLHLDQTNEH